MRNQSDRVSSFYASGTLSVKDWKGESEAGVLTAGTRSPFRVKIEITHSWGRPLLHILMVGERFEVLSFGEKRLYLGSSNDDSLSRFFPGHLFNHTIVWAFLRGFPQVMGYNRIDTSGAGRISLLGPEEKEVEVIYPGPQGFPPEGISFPPELLDLTFAGYRENDGVLFASEVQVKSLEGGKNLILKNRKAVFNRTIPEEIFTLKKPPGFETRPLDEIPDPESIR